MPHTAASHGDGDGQPHRHAQRPASTHGEMPIHGSSFHIFWFQRGATLLGASRSAPAPRYPTPRFKWPWLAGREPGCWWTYRRTSCLLKSEESMHGRRTQPCESRRAKPPPRHPFSHHTDQLITPGICHECPGERAGERPPARGLPSVGRSAPPGGQVRVHAWEGLPLAAKGRLARADPEGGNREDGLRRCQPQSAPPIGLTGPSRSISA